LLNSIQAIESNGIINISVEQTDKVIIEIMIMHWNFKRESF
jgi:hypothetical protein